MGKGVINGLVRLFELALLDACVAAFALLCHALLPAVIARARQAVVRQAGRALLIGFVNLGFFTVVIIVLFAVKAPGTRLLGIVLAAVILAFALTGMTAVAGLVGARLRPNDPDATRQLLVGTVVLELAMLVPLAGWIILSVGIASLGCGALILALGWRGAGQVGEHGGFVQGRPWDDRWAAE